MGFGLDGHDAASAARKGGMAIAETEGDIRNKMLDPAFNRAERLTRKGYTPLGEDPQVSKLLKFIRSPERQQRFMEGNPMFQAALGQSNEQLQRQAQASGAGTGGITQSLFQNYLSQGQDFINNRIGQLGQAANIGIMGNQQRQEHFGNLANLGLQRTGMKVDSLRGGTEAAVAGQIGAENAKAAGMGNLISAGTSLAPAIGGLIGGIGGMFGGQQTPPPPSGGSFQVNSTLGNPYATQPQGNTPYGNPYYSPYGG